MVALRPEIVNEAPVDRDEPPVDTSYQLIVPELAEAPNETELPLQNEAGVVPVILGAALVKIVMALLVAGEPVTQFTFEVKMHVTTSPLFKLALV